MEGASGGESARPRVKKVLPFWRLWPFFFWVAALLAAVGLQIGKIHG